MMQNQVIIIFKKQTIVRVGGRRQKINLDECDAVFDVMDMEGQLMDLSLCNKRDRVSDVLSRSFNYFNF